MAKVFFVKLGDIFKQARQNKGLSQQEVADRMNVSRSTISLYELGTREMNFDTFLMFCEIYGLNSDEVTGQVKKYLYKK